MVDKVDSNLNPAFLIRSFTWEVLKANDPTTWDTAKYNGLTPIVPVSEEPELEEFSGPHIVYGYALDSTAALPGRKSGSVTLAVYDQNFRRLTKTLTVLQHTFERMDETARDLNEFSSRVTDRAGNKPYLGLTFAYATVGFVQGGTPEDSEDGRLTGLINIRFEYHVDYAVKQYRLVNPDNPADPPVYAWV